MNARLEVHEHSIVRANKSWCNKIVHSHEGGDRPHQHPDTGPACYTIDKREWFRKTGLRGGSTKRFTKRPRGEHMPIVELEDWQKSFEIIVYPNPPGHEGVGPGLAPAVRMQLAFGMRVSDVTGEAS